MSKQIKKNSYDGKEFSWINFDEVKMWEKFELEKSPFIKDANGRPLYEILIHKINKNEQIR